MRWLAVGLCVVSAGCARSEQRFDTSEREHGRRELSSPARASASRASAAAPTASGSALATAFAERQAERDRLLRATVESRGIADPRVLAAMRRVPRHRFVPHFLAGDAYSDRPLPIGWGQTISQPYIVAAMTEAVSPKPGDRCLEIGTGSGYQAAVLAELCARTYSIEYLPELAAFAADNLRSLGYSIELRTGDGFRGWPEAAPFDVIVVTAAPEHIPPPLLDQLAVGGRLVIPVGPQNGAQDLMLTIRKTPGRGDRHFVQQRLASVRFVPFLGDAGGP